MTFAGKLAMRAKSMLVCLLVLGVHGSTSAAEQMPLPSLLITIKGKGEHPIRALAIADPRTHEIVAQVPINGVPHQLAASSDGSLAFVTNSSFGKDRNLKPDDTIAVIDLASRKVVKVVELGKGAFPHGIVFVGGKAFFTAEGAKLVGSLDPVSGQVDWIQGTGHRGTHDLAVSSDLKRIYTPSLDPNAVSAIELVDKRPPSPYPAYTGSLDGPGPFWSITSIPVGSGPESIAISPNGKEVWVLIRGEHKISIIDTAARAVVQSIQLRESEDPHRITFTPSGNLALICNADGDLLVVDTATRREIKRVNVGNTPNVKDKAPGMETDTVLVEPDGSHAYVAVSGSNYVSILDLKTYELIGGISTGVSPEGLAWVEGKSSQ